MSKSYGNQNKRSSLFEKDDEFIRSVPYLAKFLSRVKSELALDVSSETTSLAFHEYQNIVRPKRNKTPN